MYLYLAASANNSKNLFAKFKKVSSSKLQHLYYDFQK